MVDRRGLGDEDDAATIVRMRLPVKVAGGLQSVDKCRGTARGDAEVVTQLNGAHGMLAGDGVRHRRIVDGAQTHPPSQRCLCGLVLPQDRTQGPHHLRGVRQSPLSTFGSGLRV